MLIDVFCSSEIGYSTSTTGKSIVDTLSIPIIRLSYPDFNILEISEKARNELPKYIDHDMGLSSSNRTITDLFQQFTSEENMKHIHEMEQIKKSVQVKEVKFQKNGRTIYSNVIYQPLLNSEGDIIEMLIIVFYVTSEVEKSNNLEDLMKMQERFFSFISHEFKTPITIISSAVQAMKSICGDELSDTAKRFLNQINRSILQQLRLVNNLLDISRLEAGYLKIHKKNMDIVALTRNIVDSVSLFANEKRVNIRLVSSLQKKTIAIDDEKYERILLNLLSNAIKFTLGGKSIHVNIYQKKNKVCIEVKDEGIGIPKDKQSMVFERFKQVDNSLVRTSQGTGIGLSLVKLLVKASNGKIILRSEEGKGSTFTVYFPDTLADEDDVEGSIPDAEYDRLVQAAKVEFSSIYPD
jgi:signal transduction histidine kinase